LSGLREQIRPLLAGR